MTDLPLYEAEVLFRPPTPELRFLPEGPRVRGAGRVSWVAIQHGPDATVGSLNILDLETRTNQSYPLPGRVGFAFPTSDDGTFLLGLERQLTLFDLETRTCTPVAEPVEQQVEGTIINDGEIFEQGVVFGAKDLKFAESKAGLYLLRRDGKLFHLRGGQVCSNGKVITSRGDGTYTLFDIDTPSKVVTRYRLDPQNASLEEEGIAIDLTDRADFPDGMVATPDGQGVVIAFYNPNEAEYGEAVQFGLSDGRPQAIWRVPGSPQVTCPQVIERNGSVELLLTTAVEHMPADRQARSPNAGCLFIAPTPWTTLPVPRRVELDAPRA